VTAVLPETIEHLDFAPEIPCRMFKQWPGGDRRQRCGATPVRWLLEYAFPCGHSSAGVACTPCKERVVAHLQSVPRWAVDGGWLIHCSKCGGAVKGVLTVVPL
jgi:hypothetical protein